MPRDAQGRDLTPPGRPVGRRGAISEEMLYRLRKPILVIVAFVASSSVLPLGVLAYLLSRPEATPVSSATAPLDEVKVGDCVELTGDGYVPLTTAVCGKGTLTVLRRIDRHVDTNSGAEQACRNVPGYRQWYRSTGDPGYLLCLG